MFLVSFILLSIALGATVPCNKERIISCGLQFLDLNNDGNINTTEIDTFFATEPCGRMLTHLSSVRVLELCDGNNDSVISASDYDITGTCFNYNLNRTFICATCERCEWMKK